MKASPLDKQGPAIKPAPAMGTSVSNKRGPAIKPAPTMGTSVPGAPQRPSAGARSVRKEALKQVQQRLKNKPPKAPSSETIYRMQPIDR
jgi:hypothetical protein